MPRTSAAGIAQLVADEGEVLTAYRDVVGVWTIGVGLTAASGVVKPKVGMKISREESRRLLGLALERNYEPTVAKAMPGAKVHEFDGGLLFHWNTGAIGKASWVGSWKAGNDNAARSGLLAWNKAGGKVVRGLTLRRQREADLILLGKYSHGIKPDAASTAAVTPDPEEPTAVLRRGARGDLIVDLQAGLASLGLYKSKVDGQFGPSTEAAVRMLQSAHPHLTVDGVAGPATRAQLQRMLDARNKPAVTTAGGAIAGGGSALAAVEPETLGWLVIGFGSVTVVVLAYLGWRYRDELRAWWRILRGA